MTSGTIGGGPAAVQEDALSVTRAISPVTGPEGLTPEWLTAALRSAGHEVEVQGVTTTRVGTGQLGESYRLHLDLASAPEGFPSTLVAKVATSDATMAQLVAPGYLTEVTFYQELTGDVAARIPHCWFAAMPEGASSFTLLLEDLAPAEQGDQIAGCTVEQLRAAAVNLAGLHGPRWGDPTLRDISWMGTVDEGVAAFIGQLCAASIDTVADKLGDGLSAEDRATLEASAAAIPAFLVGRRDRISFLHGDYRLDNLLFHPDGSVAAVDWQTINHGLPARDLAYLVSTSVEPEVRRQVEGDIIAAYVARLRELGVTDHAEQECFEDYRWGMLQGPLILVVGCAVGTTTERGNEMFTRVFQRSCQAIRDHGTLDLVG